MCDRRVASFLSFLSRLSGCHPTLEIGRRRVMVPEYKEEGVCRATNIKKGKRFFFFLVSVPAASISICIISGRGPSLLPAYVILPSYSRGRVARALAALPRVDMETEVWPPLRVRPPALQRLESLKGVAAVTRCGWCLHVQCTVC